MGNIDHIDRLEEYIEDFGDEISKIKTASEYLELIESFQAGITKTSATLDQSLNQLKIYQEILESKLDLFLTMVKNIETKQQILEQTQVNIISSLSEIKEHQANNKKDVMGALNGITQLANNNHNEVVSELKKIYQQQEENQGSLIALAKNSKTYFIINAILIASVLGTLGFLLIR